MSVSCRFSSLSFYFARPRLLSSTRSTSAQITTSYPTNSSFFSTGFNLDSSAPAVGHTSFIPSHHFSIRASNPHSDSKPLVVQTKSTTVSSTPTSPQNTKIKTTMATNPLIKQVCIVGGGNAAHALAALFPYKGFKTVWLADYGDEAERIQAGLNSQNGEMVAHFSDHCIPNGTIKGKVDKVSKHAKDVIPESNVLILPLPSFAYSKVLQEIKPYVQKGTYIGVTPGQGGFDWTAAEILGDLCRDLIFFAIVPMPFNCRISEFGKCVEVQIFKKNYRVGALPESAKDDVLSINTSLFGNTEYVGHFLSVTLYPINAIIHPQRLYVLCKDWKPGVELPENPLFYESMNELSTDYMDKVNKELIQIAQALNRSGFNVNVPHILEFLGWVYVEEGKFTKLIDLFTKNGAYKGFRCPYKQLPSGGWEPDFKNRYFTEDIPYGLCVYKGVADLVDVKTPVMDEVLTWAQTNMGKEYIKDGKLQGIDVGETTAPQRYGITTLDQLKDL